MKEKTKKRQIILFELFFFLFLFLICVYLIKVDIPRYEESKESNAESMNDGIEMNGYDVLLNHYDDNLWIRKGGTYQISGTLKNHFLVVDTEENVTLIFNNVTFYDEKEVSIINKQSNDLTLYLTENSKNIIKGIVSNGNVFIDGSGTLVINSNQKETQIVGNLTMNDGVMMISSGCDVKGNLVINQGFVRILSEMTVTGSTILNDGTFFLQEKNERNDSSKWIINGGNFIYFGMVDISNQMESHQNILSYTLNKAVEDDLVSIQKDNEEFLSIQVPSAFKSIAISVPSLNDGLYTFYSGGNHLGNLENGIYGKGLYIGGTKLEEFEYKSNKMEHE